MIENTVRAVPEVREKSKIFWVVGSYFSPLLNSKSNNYIVEVFLIKKL